MRVKLEAPHEGDGDDDHGQGQGPAVKTEGGRAGRGDARGTLVLELAYSER